MAQECRWGTGGIVQISRLQNVPRIGVDRSASVQRSYGLLRDGGDDSGILDRRYITQASERVPDLTFCAGIKLNA